MSSEWFDDEKLECRQCGHPRDETHSCLLVAPAPDPENDGNETTEMNNRSFPDPVAEDEAAWDSLATEAMLTAENDRVTEAREWLEWFEGMGGGVDDGPYAYAGEVVVRALLDVVEAVMSDRDSVERTHERLTKARGAEITRLRTRLSLATDFIRWVLVNREQAGWFQADIEEKALEMGLMVEVEVSEPCGETCACAEWDGFPQTCLRPALTRIREEKPE